MQFFLFCFLEKHKQNPNATLQKLINTVGVFLCKIHYHGVRLTVQQLKHPETVKISSNIDTLLIVFLL